MKEGFVARDVVGGHKLFGQECVALNRNTPLWGRSAQRVNGAGPWRQPAKPAEPRCSFQAQPIASGMVTPGCWDWEHYLPNPRRTVSGVAREQFVQKR